MDSKRGAEGSAGKGEVVDMQTGLVESSDMMGGTKEVNGGAVEKTGEQHSGAGQAMPSVSNGSVTNAVATDDDATMADGDAQSDLVNLTTKDGEKIEKEWVKKIENIVGGTRDDPRRREDEVFKVKKDFIFKRFGRKIGKEKQ